MKIEHVPATFADKGRYRTYARDWTPTGYADEPQYAGQQPHRFPAGWAPSECFLGFRLVE